MLSNKKSVKIMFFMILQNSDVTISFVPSFYITICILLYYFDPEFFRYKPSKIHQNPGFRPTLKKMCHGHFLADWIQNELKNNNNIFNDKILRMCIDFNVIDKISKFSLLEIYNWDNLLCMIQFMRIR